jgi:hypothetical protein
MANDNAVKGVASPSLLAGELRNERKMGNPKRIERQAIETLKLTSTTTLLFLSE